MNWPGTEGSVYRPCYVIDLAVRALCCSADLYDQSLDLFTIVGYTNDDAFAVLGHDKVLIDSEFIGHMVSNDIPVARRK